MEKPIKLRLPVFNGKGCTWDMLEGQRHGVSAVENFSVAVFACGDGEFGLDNQVRAVTGRVLSVASDPAYELLLPIVNPAVAMHTLVKGNAHKRVCLGKDKTDAIETAAFQGFQSLRQRTPTLRLCYIRGSA